MPAIALPNPLTINTLRRFLETGVNLVRDRPYERRVHAPFQACEMAQYLRLTAAQSFVGLDAFAEKKWVAYVGEDDGLETWQLTRSGWYAQQNLVGARQLTKAAAQALEKAFDAVGRSLEGDSDVVQVLGHGPWMSKDVHGAVVIGLACKDWPSIPAQRRLQILQNVLVELKASKATAHLVVMGFTADHGIPERLRTHRLLDGQASSQQTVFTGVDVGEKSYAKQLESDLNDYDMAPRGPGELDHGKYYWWSTRRIVSVDLTAYMEDREPRPPAPIDPFYAARRMLSEEYWCLKFCAPVAQKPTRKAKKSPSAKDQFGHGAEWLARHELYFGRITHLTRTDMDSLPSIADELCEKGLLDKASVKLNPVVRALNDELDRDSELPLQVLHAAVQKLHKELGLYVQSKIEKTKNQVSFPVKYLAAFFVGGRMPIPLALVRQPSGHSASISGVRSTVYDLLRDNRHILPARDQDLANDLCNVVTRFRPATDVEVATIEEVIKSHGKKVRYILQVEKGESLLFTNSYGDHVKAGDMGIMEMKPLDQLPAYIDVDWGVVSRVRSRKKLMAPEFYKQLQEWMFVPDETGIMETCAMLLDPANALGQNVRAAIDPKRAWQFERDGETYTARISCAPLMITVTGLCDKHPPTIKLQIRDWILERKLSLVEECWGRRKDSYPGKFSCVMNIFTMLSSCASEGLRQACANRFDLIRYALRDSQGNVEKDWIELDDYHLAAGLLDAVISYWPHTRSTCYYKKEFSNSLQE